MNPLPLFSDVKTSLWVWNSNCPIASFPLVIARCSKSLVHLQRNFKRRPSQEPSSAALQKEVLKWYKICKEEYAKSVTMSHRETQETIRKQAKYTVPMAAYAYSKARPEVVNII